MSETFNTDMDTGVAAASLESIEAKPTSTRENLERARALYRATVKDDQSSAAFLKARRCENVD